MTSAIAVSPLSEERPWGSWHVVDQGDGYKVKRLQVNVGCRLSYQKHRFRSEHWTVVAGTARCTVDDQAHLLAAGASIDVPLGAKHRLANEGPDELVVLEVQCGDYTGEDDILRLEDDYGRHRAVSVG